MEKVTRVPIKVERIPIQENRLPWDDIYKKFVNYIKFAAKSVYNTYQTESAEDLFQEGQLLMYQCWLTYGNKSMEEFSYIFKASLWRKMREVSSKKQVYGTDFDTLVDSGLEPGYEPDLEQSVDEQLRFQKLLDSLSDEPVALTILREFISPGDRTLWEAQMETARKAMLRAQNYAVTVPSSPQVTKRIIQRGMEISMSKFDQHFTTLKKAMRQVYGERQASV